MRLSVLLLLLLSLFCGCSKSTTPVTPSVCDAEDYSHQVKATIDVTSLEAFCAQMPDTIQPEISRGRGQDRIFTWVFPDGSKIVTYFRPSPIPGGGLVLYMVDVEK